ncbi:MAG: hypothetical protein IPK32_19700 [Verrucomicrobiaceae bacterium]|nr:hypothetical protein [Verrucomicrobiaceae bacterium]
MKSDLGPLFYRAGIIGMIVLIPVSAFLLFIGPSFGNDAVKWVVFSPFAAFWLFMKGREWRDEGYWS